MGVKLLGGRRGRWVAVVPLAALLGCLVLSTVVYRGLEVCVPASRATLTEFPAFGDADIDPDPNPAGSKEDCNATFTTTAPADRVIGYYRQQLSTHGWAIGPGGLEQGSGLTGTRGDLCYFMTYQAHPNPVSIQVMRTNSGSKLAPAGQC